MAVESNASGAERLLLFEVDSLQFGLSLAVVEEVLPSVVSHELPGAPPVVEGVVSVRGEHLAVFDLRRRFGLEPREAHVDDHLILACTDERRVLVRVDRVVEIIDAGERVAPAPVDADGQICGVVDDGDGLWMIQDLQAFLRDDESEQLAAALARQLADRREDPA